MNYSVPEGSCIPHWLIKTCTRGLVYTEVETHALKFFFALNLLLFSFWSGLLMVRGWTRSYFVGPKIATLFNKKCIQWNLSYPCNPLETRNVPEKPISLKLYFKTSVTLIEQSPLQCSLVN